MYGYEMVKTIKTILAIAEETNRLIEDANRFNEVQDRVSHILGLAFGNKWTTAQETVFCIRAVCQALEETGMDEVSECIWEGFMDVVREDSANASDPLYYLYDRPDMEYGDIVAHQSYIEALNGEMGREYNHARREKEVREAESIEDAPLKKGDVIEVIKGRKYPKGTQFTCLGFYTSDYDGSTQVYVGKDGNGKKMYVALANCKVVSLNPNFKTDYSVGDRVNVGKDVINPQTNEVIVKAGEYTIEGFYTKYNWYEVKATEYLIVDGGKRLNRRCAEPIGFEFA